jgi:hypothetical protein
MLQYGVMFILRQCALFGLNSLYHRGREDPVAFDLAEAGASAHRIGRGFGAIDGI